MKFGYLAPLDGVRACAFILVFIAHAGITKSVPGGLGVSFFFFLSGYLITSLLRTEWDDAGHISLRNFYVRRALRILPPLYVVLLITTLLGEFNIPNGSTSGFGLLSVFFYFYNYASLFNTFFNTTLPRLSGGTGVVWSLMIEEHFYIIFPFLYLFLRKARITRNTQVKLFVAACGAALAWRLFLTFVVHVPAVEEGWTYLATDCRFDSILWGCILAVGANPWLGDRHPFLEKYKGLLAIGGLTLLLVTLLFRDEYFRATFRYSLQGIAMLPIFYYIASCPSAWQVRWLSWKFIRWVGWISYTMYLFHRLALFSFERYTSWNPFAIALVSLGTTMLFAEAVRFFIETPLRELKKRKALETRTVVTPL